MTELSTAAWVLHDLGLAANFGSNLFGQLAMNQAVNVIDDEKERGKVMQETLKTHKIVNATALGLLAGTWLLGRTVLSESSIPKEARTLTFVKDGLIAAQVATGVAGMITGSMLSSAVAMNGGMSSEKNEMGGKVKNLSTAVNVIGATNIALAAGVIGITAILAITSAKQGFFSKIFS